MMRPASQRTTEAARADLAQARIDLATSRDFTELVCTPDELEALHIDAERHVNAYFQIEDPTVIRPIGLELKLQAPIGSTMLRGIIDRLELDEHGELVVTDYKTGSVPHANYEHGKLTGVHLYALLCDRVFGRRPSRIQLLYLSGPTAIVATPSEQSVSSASRKTAAVYQAVARACERNDFRPNPGRLCDWCSYREFCPAFGGDPATAVSLLGTRKPADTGTDTPGTDGRVADTLPNLIG